uniref:(northern house mosquito) hypothetical protein n=1 Tax=Culex pipiens TaxID=7175 RepID=A0A8D8I1G8_CULPI
MAPHKLSWHTRPSQSRSFFWFLDEAEAKIDAKENKMLPRCEVSVILPVKEREMGESKRCGKRCARERKGRRVFKGALQSLKKIFKRERESGINLTVFGLRP